MEDSQCSVGGSVVGSKGSLLSCVLGYLEAREAAVARESAELEAGYLLRTQRLLQFHGPHHGPGDARVVPSETVERVDDIAHYSTENELSNWTVFLNGASRALVNSGALMENIHNLIVAQQKMCAEVASSELFLSAGEGEGLGRDLAPSPVSAAAAACAGAGAQLSSTPVVDH